MSRFGAPNDITVMLFLMGFFLIASNISTVESRSDVGSVIEAICSPTLLSPNDPYLALVNSMLDDITTTTPDDPDFVFSTIYPGQGFNAYGYGECDPSGTADDCYHCLSECTGQFYPECGPAIGAQINMAAGCFMRYENYQFF